MREINNVELAAVSGGDLDGRDVASAMGAWIGYAAAQDLFGGALSVGGYNVGGVVSGVVFAMGGAVVGRFADALLDSYINPVVDNVVS